jgi:NAD(P)-dependent dehydrogenase (short-subunit alcohol dehydrogenase family)
MKDKVALITGGASGIGKASARLLAEHGARVVVADLNADGAAATAREINGISCSTDVGDSRAVAAMVARTVEAYGRIDVLLHAAGIFPRNPYFEMSDEAWRQVLRVNLDGTFYVTREVGRVMKGQRAGTMILMTSDRGIHGSADFAHYAASKGGMLALVKSLALVLGKDKVTVNGINPGLTDTPLARAGNSNWEEKQALDVLGGHTLPEQVAQIVLFLAATAGAFMTGQIISARMRYGA